MWSTVTAYWMLFLGTIGAIERAHMARVTESAKGIQVGATEETSSSSRKPFGTYERYDGWSFLGIGAHPTQWFYGTRINIKKLIVADNYVMAIPLPINIDGSPMMT